MTIRSPADLLCRCILGTFVLRYWYFPIYSKFHVERNLSTTYMDNFNNDRSARPARYVITVTLSSKLNCRMLHTLASMFVGFYEKSLF